MSTMALPPEDLAPSAARGPLVATEWLAEHLDDPSVRVVDCRWYLRPFDDRCGDDEYRAGHIPGAVHLRWDTQLADPDRPAHMLASPERFAAAMEAAGIGDDTFVVTYDDHHVPVASRVWWALRAFGHDAVAVLDGGITRWRTEGRATSTETPKPRRATFTPRFRPDRYVTKTQMLDLVASGDTVLVDARMDKAFDSATGHIPGATRLTGLGFLADGERWMSPDAARARIEAVGIDATRPVVTYCGGGVAATGAALAFVLAGLEQPAVYDGSWSEWDADPDTPKVRH
jgi:thiosulfate/3-mercaptopyruvate sulfurtransferase